MVHSATKAPTIVKVQPAEYRKTGTPTTNQTSRAPNSATRAAASRLMPRLLAKSSRADFEALRLPISGGTKASTPASTSASSAAIAHSAAWNPSACSSTPPRKKPAPFIAFLLPVKKATHLNSRPDASPAVSLMADLLAVLVRSLATPHTPWAATTQATESAADQSGDSADSSRKPVICVARPTASMRAMPKRVASQPPTRLATMPAASYSRNRKASVNGE